MINFHVYIIILHIYIIKSSRKIFKVHPSLKYMNDPFEVNPAILWIWRCDEQTFLRVRKNVHVLNEYLECIFSINVWTLIQSYDHDGIA